VEPCPACLAKYLGEGRWLCGRREEEGKVVKRCRNSVEMALAFLDGVGIQGRKLGYHQNEEERAEQHARHIIAVSHVVPAPTAPMHMKAEFSEAVMSAYDGRSKK